MNLIQYQRSSETSSDQIRLVYSIRLKYKYFKYKIILYPMIYALASNKVPAQWSAILIELLKSAKQ